VIEEDGARSERVDVEMEREAPERPVTRWLPGGDR
jgi:hypothetical protein